MPTHTRTSVCSFPGPDSIFWCHLTSIRNLIVEIRRSYDRLISTMGFPILVRQHLHMKSGPECYDCDMDAVSKLYHLYIFIQSGMLSTALYDDVLSLTGSVCKLIYSLWVIQGICSTSERRCNKYNAVPYWMSPYPGRCCSHESLP